MNRDSDRFENQLVKDGEAYIEYLVCGLFTYDLDHMVQGAIVPQVNWHGHKVGLPDKHIALVSLLELRLYKVFIDLAQSVEVFAFEHCLLVIYLCG